MKYFTCNEANNTLPLVKKIVNDILWTGRRLIIFNSISRVENSFNDEIEILKGKLRGYLMELEELGCFYKDWNFEFGLVDFPAVIEEKEVMLCWRSDEDTISYYHGTDDGYPGRKPLPMEYFDE